MYYYYQYHLDHSGFPTLAAKDLNELQGILEEALFYKMRVSARVPTCDHFSGSERTAEC